MHKESEELLHWRSQTVVRRRRWLKLQDQLKPSYCGRFPEKGRGSLKRNWVNFDLFCARIFSKVPTLIPIFSITPILIPKIPIFSIIPTQHVLLCKYEKEYAKKLRKWRGFSIGQTPITEDRGELAGERGILWLL